MLNIEVAYNKNFTKFNKVLPKFINNFFIKLLQKLFHEKTFNDIYIQNHYQKNLDFVDSMVDLLNIKSHLQIQKSKVANFSS